MPRLDNYNEELLKKVEENIIKLCIAMKAGEYKRAGEILERIDEILKNIDDPLVVNSSAYKELVTTVKKLKRTLKMNRIFNIILMILPIIYLAIIIILWGGS